MCHNNKNNIYTKKVTWWQRVTAFLLCCGMVVNFVLPSDLILPVIAEGKIEELICEIEEHVHSPDCYELICEDDSEEHEHTEECYELICGMEEHIHSEECYQEVSSDVNLNFARMEDINILSNDTDTEGDVPAVYTETGSDKWVNLDGNINGLTIYSGGGTYTQEKDEQGNNVVTLNGGDAESIDVKVALNFHFDDGEELNKIIQNRYLYFAVPEGSVRITNAMFGSNCISTDEEYNKVRGNNEPSGYFSISQGGFLVVKLTQDYVNYLSTAHNLRGTAAFDGTIDRENDEYGDRTIKVSDGQYIKVQFNDTKLSMTKTGTVVLDGENRYIDWKVTITNPQKRVDMTGWTLSDLLNDSEFDISNATVEPSGCGSGSGKNFVFTSKPDSETITVTYRQYNVNSGSTNNNKATLSKTDREPINATHSIFIQNKIDFEKTGLPDYQTGKDANGEIQWTINLHNLSGDSLKGTYIDDNKITVAKGVKVYYMNGNVQTELSSECYTVTDGKLTFKSDDSTIPSDLTVVYNSPANRAAADSKLGSADTSNSATIGTNLTDRKPNLPDNPTKTFTVTYQNEVSLVKSYDDMGRDTSKVKWRIAVYSNATSWDEKGWRMTLDDSNSATIDGYEITDPMFNGLNASDFSYNAFHAVGDDSRSGRGSAYPDNTLIITKVVYDDNKQEVAEPTDEQIKAATTIRISVKDNAPINYAALFYSTELNDTQKEAYDNGQEVTITNHADVNGDGLTAGDDGAVTIQARVEADKTYNGVKNNLSTVVTGEKADNADRILQWSMTLINDTGFKANTSTVTDILQSDVTGAEHYIASNQTNIVLYGYTSEQDLKNKENSTQIDSDYYTITYYDADGNETYTDLNTNHAHAVKFVITFKTKDVNGTLQNLDSSIRYIGFDYESTAVIAVQDDNGTKTGVTNGTTAHFDNQYKIGEQDFKTTTGMTFERKDPHVIPTMKLNVNKSWNDADNVFGSRPDTIKVKVQQAPAVNENNDAPADNSDTWKDYQVNNETVVFELTKNNGSYYFTLSPDFPQWQVNEADETITRLYYRVVELDVDEHYTVSYGSNRTYGTNAVIGNDGGGTCNLTNNSTQHAAKTAYDKDGNPVTQFDPDSYQTVTVKIDDVDTECYVFGWKANVLRSADDNSSSDASRRTYIDTLPENTYYITPDMVNDSKYHACLGDAFTANAWHVDISTLNYKTMNVTQNGTTLTLVAEAGQNFDTFSYYTATPKDKIDATLGEDRKLVNTITKKGDSADGRAEIKAVKETTPVNTDLLRKKYERSITEGKLIYELDFNPQGQRLSNESMIEILDALSVDADSTKTADQLGFSVNVSVIPINEDGTKGTPLASGQYSYRAEYNVQERTEIPVSEWKKVENSKEFRTTALTPGSKLYVELFYPEYNQYSDPNLQFYSVESYEATSITTISSVNSEYKTVQSMIVPNNSSTTYALRSNASDFEILSCYMIETTPVLLHINVPDGQHYKIRYTYTVSGYTSSDVNGNGGDTIYFSNKAKFQTDSAASEDTSSHDQMNVQKSAVQTSTDTYPQIYKVDVNNEGNNLLDATFKIARYNNGSWIYADGISTILKANGTESDAYRQLSFKNNLTESNDSFPADAQSVKFSQTDDASTSDRENLHNFLLDAGTLYKFVEVTAPTSKNGITYQSPDWSEGKTLADNSSFVFYYTYSGYDETKYGTKPSGIEITNVPSGNALNIKNSQYISISAQKSFSGASSTIPSSSKVELELLWSLTNNSKDAVPLTTAISEKNLTLGSGFTSAKVEVTYPDNAVVTWNGLPSGIDGKSIFYFVRENYYTNGTSENAPKYSLQSDGTYQTASGDTGSFKPVYTGNGTNVSGTVIDVNNSSGLVIEKKWEDLDRNAVTPPNEPGTSTPMAIGFTVKGMKADGTEITFNLGQDVTLNNDNHYQYPLIFPVTGTDGNSYQQSDFVDITVEENLTTVQQNALHGKYKDSPDYTRKIENNVGKLMIINTKIVNSTTSASVSKTWSDGESAHLSDSVTAYLIQSRSELTPAQLKLIETNDTNKPVYYTGEAMTDGDDVLFLMNEKSKTVSGVKSVSITDETVASGTVSDNALTLQGLKTGTTEIIITKTDDSTKDYTISVINPEVTLSDGNWSAKWENLPRSVTENDTEITYYYYAIEKTVPTGYTSSYEINGQQTVIKNSKPTKLTVTKVWGDMNATDADAYQKTVIAELQYKLGDNGSWTAYTPSQTVTLSSDSWTASFDDLPVRNDNDILYYYRVVEKQVGDSTNLDAFEIVYSPENVNFENLSNQAITITNTLKTVSLKLKKDWVGKVPDENDTVNVRISRSTNRADAPAVTTIAEETTKPATTTTVIEEETTTEPTQTNAFPYYYTETISTDKVIKIKFKNNGTTALTFSGGWGVTPQSAQSSDPGSDWVRGEDGNGNPNSWWIQYNWSVENLAKNAETEIEIPVVVALSNNSELQLWYVSSGDTKTAPITAEITVVDANQGEDEEDTFSFIPDSNTSKTINIPDGATGVKIHVDTNNNWEYVQVEFGENLGGIKAGWYSMNGNNFVDAAPDGGVTKLDSKYYSTDTDGNLTITFDSTFPSSFDIKLASDNATSGTFKFVTVSSPLPRRQIRPVTSTLSRSSEEAVTSSNTDTVLSRMMGGRSGAVSRMMNLKSTNTFRTLNDTISYFNANSGIVITMVFNETVTITSTDNWEKTITNLPAYDLSGNPYYYWAEETKPTGFDVSYQFDDGDNDTIYCINASNPGTGLITIQNKKTESESSDLPEAGGTGTAPYRTAGTIIMFTALTIPYIRRKRQNGRKSA